MSKKSILYLVIFLIVLTGIFSFGYFFRNSLVFAVLGDIEEPQKIQANVHYYGDELTSIKDVLVRVYYVSTKDNELAFDNWKWISSTAMKKVTVFFELQFGYDMSMAFRVYPQEIPLQESSDYFVDLVKQDYAAEIAKEHSPSLVAKAVVDAVKEKVKAEKVWDLTLKRVSNAYVVNLFVLTLDIDDLNVGGLTVLGLNDESNNSIVFSTGFTKKEFEGFYESVVGHEIGHGLGIPRHYSYTSDEVQTSGMMGGGLTRNLKDNYLNHAIKDKMITH